MLVLRCPFARYGAAAALVALALALRLALVSQGYLFLFFYPAVAAAAWWGGVGPGLAAAVLSAVLVNLVLVPPASAANLQPEALAQAAAFVAAAGMVGWLTGRARAAAAEREGLLARERCARAAAEAAVGLRDEFLSIAAHELKTPLTSVRASAAMLARAVDRDRVLDPAVLRRAVERVGRQSEKMGQLVTQLLDLSRIEAGQLALAPEPTDLVPLFEEAVAAVQATAPDHALRLRAPARLAAVVDPLRVEQVLVNLLGNAVKYSPAGPVDVDLAAPAPDAVRVAVRDRGPGVPPALRGRLFQRYARGHGEEHRSGMGLGLYVSRRIVELHAGTIRHEAPPDGGSRFVVDLPRGVAPGPGATGADAQRPVRRLLVADHVMQPVPVGTPAARYKVPDRPGGRRPDPPAAAGQGTSRGGRRG